MFERIAKDIDAVVERDPAVRSRLEVVLLYPGFHARLFHRAANAAWRQRWFLLGKFLSQFGRWVTGIEIHPAAVIGGGFFIDHGMGVVIGETSVIGEGVTLYHDVTLGGISPAVDSHSQVNEKRHPTLEDDVIVGSGAQILGPITIGEGARVGANSVVLKDVARGATVVGIPAKPVRPGTRPKKAFDAYGVTAVEMPDPVARALEGLLDNVQTLSARLTELENERDSRADALARPWPGGHEGANDKVPPKRDPDSGG